MAERAETIGGRLELESSPGAGVRLRATAPTQCREAGMQADALEGTK